MAGTTENRQSEQALLPCEAEMHSPDNIQWVFLCGHGSQLTSHITHRAQLKMTSTQILALLSGLVSCRPEFQLSLVAMLFVRSEMCFSVGRRVENKRTEDTMLNHLPRYLSGCSEISPLCN